MSLFESISLELVRGLLLDCKVITDQGDKINRTVSMDIVVTSSLKHFIQKANNTIYPSDGERLALESCLVGVLGKLCDILLYFAEEHKRRQTISPPEPLFEVCGSRLRNSNRYMIRRSLDHLALCMVNMSVGRTPPKGYGQLLSQISQVSENPNDIWVLV